MDRATDVTIRDLAVADRTRWEPLWLGYHRFYRSRVSDELTESSFAMLTGEANNVFGFVAESKGEIVGFVHCILHPSCWQIGDSCYLQDLFVDSNIRGHGVGRALIEAVYAQADKVASGHVHWLTQEYNADARALYDTLAQRTSFIQYSRSKPE